ACAGKCQRHCKSSGRKQALYDCTAPIGWTHHSLPEVPPPRRISLQLEMFSGKPLLAEPAVGQMHLECLTQLAFRADAIAVADNSSSRRPTDPAAIGHKLPCTGQRVPIITRPCGAAGGSQGSSSPNS